jgi:hypothetical protein
MLTTNPLAFKHFKKTGTEAVCLVDYNKKTVVCAYKTMNECREQYADHKVAVCFPRKALKLAGDN